MFILPDDQLLLTMLDIFQAGIETTSNTLSWTILFLILNPHVQDKLFEEISRIVPRGEQITLDYKNRFVVFLGNISCVPFQEKKNFSGCLTHMQQYWRLTDELK